MQFSYHFGLLIVELFFSSAAAERKVHLSRDAVLLTRIFENNGYHLKENLGIANFYPAVKFQFPSDGSGLADTLKRRHDHDTDTHCASSPYSVFLHLPLLYTHCFKKYIL